VEQAIQQVAAVVVLVGEVPARKLAVQALSVTVLQVAPQVLQMGVLVVRVVVRVAVLTLKQRVSVMHQVSQAVASRMVQVGVFTSQPRPIQAAVELQIYMARFRVQMAL
jgi:hypothetical protein